MGQVDSLKLPGLEQVDPTGGKPSCPSLFSLPPTIEYVELRRGKGKDVWETDTPLVSFRGGRMGGGAEEWPVLLPTAGPQKHRARLCWAEKNRHNVHLVCD